MLRLSVHGEFGIALRLLSMDVNQASASLPRIAGAQRSPSPDMPTERMRSMHADPDALTDHVVLNMGECAHDAKEEIASCTECIDRFRERRDSDASVPQLID